MEHLKREAAEFLKDLPQEYCFNGAKDVLSSIGGEGLKLSAQAVVVDSGGSVLLVQNQKVGGITFPGGKADGKDKSLADTAIRETMEEVGVSLNAEQLWRGAMPVWASVFVVKKLPLLDFGFVFKVDTVWNSFQFKYHAEIKRVHIIPPYHLSKKKDDPVIAHVGRLLLSHFDKVR